MDRMKENGEEKPSLIIFDMNNANAKPLTLIPKLKSKLKKGTSIIGFLSHVQGDLKQKAHEVGCDMVLPRSAFSQNLPQLLRRHGAPEEEETAKLKEILARRPGQIAAAQQMHMQMKHRLSRPWSDVEYGAVSILDSALTRDFRRREMTAANDLRVRRPSLPSTRRCVSSE